MNANMIDVLIAGAGPTGTALAIDLVRRGLTVRIVDQRDHGFEGSRAKGIQPRSLEVLEDLGALDEILAGGTTYPPLGIHLGPLCIPFRMIKRYESTSDEPYADTWLIPQHRTDAALHAQLKRMGQTVEFGCEFAGFEQTVDAVTARITGANGSESISARYLVGADGGSSKVRSTMDVGFYGSTDEDDRIVIVDADVSGLSRDRWHIWPGGPGRFIGACPLPHSEQFQWMIRIRPDEDATLSDGQIQQRIHKRTGNKQIQLSNTTWKSVFRPNIRLVQHYRQGHVLLAGDAAHIHTPAGAQGLNTGLQDAYNLGWKLGQVIAGAPDSLLDTYEAERMPIAASVLKLSTKKYQGIGKLDPSSMTRGQDERQISLCYRGGTLAPVDSERTGTLQVGDRAPDAKLLCATGGPRRLFELMQGPHFTAIAWGSDAASSLATLQWPETGAPLRRVAIDAGVHAAADVVLADIAGSFRRTYGLQTSTLLLIRPDGYIGSITSSDYVGVTQARAQMMTPPAIGT